MNEIKYIEPQQESQLYNDVCQIIDGARSRIATYVNTEACLTNWYVGKRIKEDILYETLCTQCVPFSEEEIRYATRTQLNWTHLRSLMGIKDPLERQFYAQMCSTEHWDTRIPGTLRHYLCSQKQ